jgi:hypothetical protein
MTVSSDRRHKFEPLFDIDPVTGASVEIFWADATLATFGRVGAGWWWHFRLRGLAPDGPAHGPFPTSYSAYKDALHSAQRSGQLFSACGCNRAATTIQEKMTESD